MKIKIPNIITKEYEDIWVTSDTHYWHKNIVSGESVWADKSVCRVFNTTRDMSQALINSINAYAKPDDLLIHLGDWSFSGINNIANFRRQLKVHDIIIATGNHDTHIQQNRLLTNCSYGEAKALGAKQNLNYADSDDVGAADLFMHVTPYLEISIDGQFIVLCHYPMASWNHSYKGSWMLHGHSHGSLFVNEPKDHWYKTSKIMDVGIDCAFDRYGEYKPFSIKEIREIMNKKSFRSVDHHNENTDK